MSMVCPVDNCKCRTLDSRKFSLVKNVKPLSDKPIVCERRHVCLKCGTIFYTHEYIVFTSKRLK